MAAGRSKPSQSSRGGGSGRQSGGGVQRDEKTVQDAQKSSDPMAALAKSLGMR